MMMAENAVEGQRKLVPEGEEVPADYREIYSNDELDSNDEVKNDYESESTTSSLCVAPVVCAKEEVGRLISRARSAQAIAENYSQEQVDRLIRGLVWSVAQPGIAESIAEMCVEETRLGNYHGKYTKLAKKTRAALMDILNDKSVGVVEVDEDRALMKIAKPVGVIGATSPSTNPEATPVIKAINAIKARNAIVISPHPRALRTNQTLVANMRKALEALGAPADLIIGVDAPTREKTNELMRQCDLVLATGGQNIVKYAYSAGRPALGVGVGNAVVTVDDTADIADAAQKIRLSKTFDFAASCSADNSLVVFASIYDKLVAELEKQGGYIVSPEEYTKLALVLFKPNGALNPLAVVQSAADICKLAGIHIPDGRSFVIVPETGVGIKHPFSGEKLSPVVALYKVDNITQAVTLTNRIQQYQGMGHSCGIYSKNDDNILQLALGTKTSRIMVNQPQSLSNSGSLANGMRQTLSLGCGSWGGNATNENINWRNLVNITWVSRPLAQPKVLPTDQELFGQDIMDLLSV